MVHCLSASVCIVGERPVFGHRDLGSGGVTDAGPARSAVRHSALQIPFDVFHHDDGVVDDDADRKHQSEQREIVERDPDRVVRKMILLGRRHCRNQGGRFVLKPASVFGVPRHGPRANCKGFLRLSLATCPVALYPATSESEKISFNQLNRKTGHRIKYAKIGGQEGQGDAGEEVGVQAAAESA
jgi:hypothetical protein